MAKTGSINRHRDENRAPARTGGTLIAVPGLFAVAMLVAVACGLAAAHGDLALALASGLVCGLASLAPVLLLRGLPRSGSHPAAADGLTRADWVLVGEAVRRFARGRGCPPVQRLELYRFRRPGRSALVLLVRLDDTGTPLAASTFDVELQKETNSRAPHGWRRLLMGIRRS